MARSELIYAVELVGYDPSRSNLVAYPREFDNAYWGKVASSIGVNAGVAADGQTLADKLTENNVNTDHYMDATTITSVATNQSFVIAIYAKNAGRNSLRIATLAGATFANVARTIVDLTTGACANATAGTGVVTTAYAQPLWNGWWRCVLVAVPETSNSNNLKIRLQLVNGGTTYLGDGTSGILLDRILVETGTVLRDPINNVLAGPGTKTLYYSSGKGFTTKRTDIPTETEFASRLQNPINYSRSLIGNGRVAGGMRIDQGEIVLNNADQALSGLRDLGFSGRTATVRVGPQDGAYPSAFTTFLTGVIEQVEVSVNLAKIRLRDRMFVLSQPLQTTVYAGTNSGLPLTGAEGVASDLKGKTKPLLYGRRYKFAPALVNTDKLTYQVHDGAVQAIDAVYANAVSLTAGADFANLAALEAAAPGAGTFITCKALGLFRLGSDPLGKVLVDAQGDNTGGYISKPGEIVNRLLTTRCGFASGDIDSATFTAINAAVTGEVGLYFGPGEVPTRLDALSQLVNTFGGWLAPSRTGLWQIGQLVAPPGSPTYTFTDADIIDIDNQATNDPAAGVPVWRVNLKYKPYATVVSSEIAASITTANPLRNDLLNQWRVVNSSDTAVKTTHLLAPEMDGETLFNVAADAQAEADRRLALHKVRRDFTKVVVWLTAANAGVDLGKEVRLVTPRLGYSSGRNFTVVGITLDGRRSKVTLDLWG